MGFFIAKKTHMTAFLHSLKKSLGFRKNEQRPPLK